MATLKTLEAEIAGLKKRVATLEKETGVQKTPEQNIVAQPQQSSTSVSTWGIILIVIGGLLTLTMFGAIIGIPLLIWGILKVVSHKPSPQVSSPRAQKTASDKKSVVKELSARNKTTLQESSVSHGIEERMGMKWLGIIGITMLVLGVGYFIKYTVDNNWFGETTSILLSVILCISMLVAGFLIKGDLKYWANILSGGGFALLYYVIYACYHFPVYREAFSTNKYVVLVLLTVVVIVSIMVALRKNERIIASESLLLGYVTALLSTQEQAMTLAYISILSLAYIFIAAKKNWLELDVGSLGLTYILYIIWLNTHPGEFLVPALFLCIYAVLFAFAHLKRKFDHRTIVFSIINSVLYFVFFISLLVQHYPDVLWLWSLGVAVVYFILGKYCHLQKAYHLMLVYLYFLVFYTVLGIFDAFDVTWVTIVLAVFVYALYYMGAHYRGPATALVVLIIFKTLIHNAFFVEENQLLTFLIVSLLMYGLYPLVKAPWEMKSVYPWLATVFTSLFVIELLPKGWDTLGLALVVFIFYLYGRHLKQPGYALALTTAGITVIYNGFVIPHNRILTSLVVVALLYFMRTKATEKWEPKTLYTWLSAALLFTLISREGSTFWITIFWTMLAIVLLLVGFSVKQKDFRLQGILILLIAVVKALVYDTSGLDEGWRTLSFIVLGVILLLASFIYAKFKDRIL